MHNTAHGETLALAGYPVFSTSSEHLCRMLQERLQAYRKTVLVFANTNFVLQCQPIRNWLNGDDVIIVNDGIGMDIASLLQHGRRYKDNLNGTDFMPLLLKTLTQNHKIFLLGGKPGVAQKAGAAIEQQTGQHVVGCADGYSGTESGALCARTNASGADIVLVAMGNPIRKSGFACTWAILMPTCLSASARSLTFFQATPGARRHGCRRSDLSGCTGWGASHGA